MSSRQKGKNDTAWEALFEKYDILNRIDMHGRFQISANQIKEFREPRLMAKFDHAINLPEVFSRNRLAILPVSRGDYLISDFEAYRKFETKDSSVSQAKLPEYVKSLDAEQITSETAALNCAYASGMLSDFLGEEELLPTVSGRMGSRQFGFFIEGRRKKGLSRVEVKNSQIEIDAAYEGRESLVLFEAKRDIAEDFLIRQLYYPYRLWQGRMEKKVRPVFLVYSNGVFYLYEYKFSEPDTYNSLILIRQKNYTLADEPIRMEDLKRIQSHTLIAEEPKIPFPQADQFRRIVNLCELLSRRKLEREEVTQEYAFDIRQTNYYTDAGRYLGLLEKEKENGRICYHLTGRGEEILRLPYKQRQLAFCKCILEHRVFSDTFAAALETGQLPRKKEIVERMKQCGLYHVGSGETYLRRSSTVSAWVQWILELAESYS